MNKYRLGEAVAVDMEAIWEYIAADDVDAADRWIDRLFTAFEQLATNPAIGHKRRTWHEPRYSSGLWERIW